MREPTFYVLLSLLEGPLHGYAVAKRAEELSEGRVRLTAGTLYGAFDRLVDQGQIELDGEELVEGRRRRYYRITGAGRQAALAEADRMRAALTTFDRAVAGGSLQPGFVA